MVFLGCVSLREIYTELDWSVVFLLAGMILGFIIPKIRWKRRRGWGEL